MAAARAVMVFIVRKGRAAGGREGESDAEQLEAGAATCRSALGETGRRSAASGVPACGPARAAPCGGQ